MIAMQVRPKGFQRQRRPARLWVVATVPGNKTTCCAGLGRFQIMSGEFGVESCSTVDRSGPPIGNPGGGQHNRSSRLRQAMVSRGRFGARSRGDRQAPACQNLTVCGQQLWLSPDRSRQPRSPCGPTLRWFTCSARASDSSPYRRQRPWTTVARGRPADQRRPDRVRVPGTAQPDRPRPRRGLPGRRRAGYRSTVPTPRRHGRLARVGSRHRSRSRARPGSVAQTITRVEKRGAGALHLTFDNLADCTSARTPATSRGR